jgi:hypothetical protein
MRTKSRWEGSTGTHNKLVNVSAFSICVEFISTADTVVSFGVHSRHYHSTYSQYSVFRFKKKTAPVKVMINEAPHIFV